MANKKTRFDQLSLSHIFQMFNSEDKCRNFLFKFKWPDGYVCPECGHKEYSFVTTRNLYQCKQCLKQASVTTNTIMQDTKLPLFTWILGLYLLSTRKDGISAESLAEHLAISTKAARLMARKIKFAMAERNSMFQLAGTIELDATFVGGPTRNGKRGLGTDKAPVLVGVSLDKGIYPEFIKFQTVDTECKAEIKNFIESHINIERLSKIISDGKSSYNFIEEEYPECELQNYNFSATERPEHLKWLHIISSNFKSFLLGNYHGIDNKYLAFALAEFEWRFNRRNKGTGMIQSITKTVMNCKVMTRKMLQDLFVEYDKMDKLSNASGS